MNADNEISANLEENNEIMRSILLTFAGFVIGQLIALLIEYSAGVLYFIPTPQE